KKSEAPGARSDTSSSNAVPSPEQGGPPQVPIPLWPGSTVTGPTSPEACTVARLSTLSESTPTLTPAPVTPNAVRAWLARWATSPSDVVSLLSRAWSAGRTVVTSVRSAIASNWSSGNQARTARYSGKLVTTVPPAAATAPSSAGVTVAVMSISTRWD